MNQLYERFQNRLARADRAAMTRTGAKLDESKKLMTAKVFKNVSEWIDTRSKLNEALDNSIGTQTRDIGAFKKFILDITEVALPNLISPEIAKIFTMDAMSGYRL